MKIIITSILVVLASTSVIAAPQPPATSVVIEPVQELMVGDTQMFNGVVRSRNDINLPTRVDGQLLWVLEEGESVAKGSVVAKLDDRELLLQKAEQELLAERAKINLEYLQGEVDRLSQLQQANLAAKTQLAELVSRRDFAKNDLSVAIARIAQLDENLARTDIVTPVDAVVVSRLKQDGEFARRGESVVRIVNPANLEVKVTVPVAYLNRVQAGNTVSVSVDGIRFEAELRSIIKAGNQASQTFDLIVDVPEDIASMMVAGQFANAGVPVTEKRTSLFVPRDAVVLRSDGNYVFIIQDDNTAKRVSVELGNGQGQLVSVRGDINVGDKVATRGVERLQDGQPVSPTNLVRG